MDLVTDVPGEYFGWVIIEGMGGKRGQKEEILMSGLIRLIYRKIGRLLYRIGASFKA